MEPTISVGDIVFVIETQEINKEDIISFRVNNSVVTHRVIDIVVDENNVKQYKTKGDSNSSEDTETVNPADIEGKYCFRIPKIGNVILFLKSGTGIVVVIFILSIAFLFAGNKKEKDKKVSKDAKNGKHSL